MKTFHEFVLLKEEEKEYITALTRIQSAVENLTPYGFSSVADEEFYRARNDVIKAIGRLHGPTIDINRPRHVA